jgi:uncharacterized protein YbbC (DUF1343 family)
VPHEEIIGKGFNLEYIIDAYKQMGNSEEFFGPRKRFFHLLTGVDYIYQMIIEGKSADEIRAMWHDDVEKFKAQRRKYLLYKE